MKPHSSSTREELESLLAWLDPDPTYAVIKFEAIQRGLIVRFLNRGCMDAETLADKTIDRVAKKVAEISGNYTGSPASYFHGVAKRVFLEYCRERRVQARKPPPEPEPTFGEIYYECLGFCLGQLVSEKRELILRYYSEMRKAKIESRKGIRYEMGLKPDALRVRTHRIRKTLEQCISKCVESNETE